MAKKLIFLFATLALFVLLVNAAAAATTVEVDVDAGDENQGRCRREFWQHQHLRACQRYMRRRAQQWGIYEDEAEVEEDDDNEDDENQWGRPALRRCCNQLRQVERPCICPVLRQAAQQQRFQGQIEGPREVRRLYRAARNLPNICNIPVGRCPF